jgi:GntR family transcriptional regulator
MQLRIADDLRMRIERGDLMPGDSLPTLQELTRQWSCSINSARAAVTLLKQQGLLHGGRGKALTVKVPPRRVVRSSERHQVEKNLVLAAYEERRGIGEAELNSGTPLEQLDFSAHYDTVLAPKLLARIFAIPEDAPLLRRVYETLDQGTGYRQSKSVSYLPRHLVEGNPDLLDQDCEPWPGGTQHQLYTVGIEIVRIADEVTARMPTTVDIRDWGLDEGVPLLRVRRTSIDREGRVVEVADSEYPADRTELRFTTPLAKWST